MDIFLLWWEDATKRKLNEKWHNTKQCFFLSPKKKFFFFVVHKWRQIYWFSSTIRDQNTVYIFIHSFLPNERYILWTCFVTIGVDLDYMAEAVFARFRHYELF